MANQKYDNEFKVMIVELLKSGIKTRQISEEYDLEVNMINRWRREYESKMVDFELCYSVNTIQNYPHKDCILA